MSLKKEIESVVKAVVDSTTRYFTFLSEHKLGVQTFPAHNIRSQNEQLSLFGDTSWRSYRCALPLHLTIHPDSSAKLTPYPEPGQEIEIRILDYDPRTGRTDLAAKKDVPWNEGDITIDFRWLVQRCLEWYQKNGKNISHIKNIEPKALDTTNAFESTPGLSSEQLFAIRTILTTGLSYVWGPPGTGKTKWVLAKAVRYCVDRNQRILILASTNLSVDNALMAILEEGGIPKEKVIRIGIPSLKRFKDEYAECCESRAFQREIQQITSQIRIIEDDINAIEKQKTLQLEVNKTATELENTLHALDSRQNDVAQIDKQICDLRPKVALCLEELNSCTRDISSKSQELLLLSFPELLSDVEQLEHDQTQTIREIAAKNNDLSNLGFFARLFTGQKDILEKGLFDRKTHLRSVEATLESKRKKRDIISPKVGELLSEISKLKSAHDQLNDDFTSSSQIMSKLEADCLFYKTQTSQLLTSIEELKKHDMKVHEELLQVGSFYTFGDINLELTSRQQEKTRLTELMQKFTQDLSEKSVLGMTLDGFMGLTLNTSIKIDRIFIDEAPYAALAKVIPLLSLHCPIAMLGDHRQLPPVCECGDDAAVCAFWAKAAIFLEDAFRCGDDWKSLNEQEHPQFELTKHCKLTESYRFGESLASVLRNHIYQGEIGLKGKANDDTLIQYVNCEPEDRCGRQRRQNYVEADKIVEWLKNWWPQYQVDPPSIAVLTPYKNQIKTIRDTIKDSFKHSELRDHLEILNTHQAQGREWDWVLFSVSDTGNLRGNNPYFTNSNYSEGKKLLNTTISRVKQRLIIFLDMEYWKHRTPTSLLTELVNLESLASKQEIDLN